MAPATIFPMLVGFADTMTNQLETGNVEELTSEEAANAAIPLCAEFERQFAQTRQQFEELLTRGVDGRAFAARYERDVTRLEAVLTRMNSLVSKLRSKPLSLPFQEFVASYRSLIDEMLRLHQFLSQAVAKAKMPMPPIDWNRAREADEAYARGETKPFRGSLKS